MNTRFKIICDENVSGAIFTLLQKWGFEVIRPKAGTPDEDIAVLAKLERRIILTFDSDFANILAYPPQELFGIIRIKLDPPVNKVVADALTKIFNTFAKPEDLIGKLIIVEAWKFRVWHKIDETKRLKK